MCVEQMLQTAHQKLGNAGYRYIGMGTFAFADDDFACAQEDGTLQHNILGYSSFPSCDTLGFGTSASSQLGELYYHNTHDLTAYQTACSNQQLPPTRGFIYNADDQVKRNIIHALTCQFSVDFISIEQHYKVNLKELLHMLWPQLKRMHNDGLLKLTEHGLQMTQVGRPFTLAVCQLFDHYFEKDNSVKSHATQAI